MVPYHSKSGKKSGVSAYKIEKDFIMVWFESTCYKYTYTTAGKTAVENMKQFALSSEGLSSFISRNKPGYEAGQE